MSNRSADAHIRNEVTPIETFTLAETVAAGLTILC